METRNLLKLCLITALVGTFLVVILANNIEPETKTIDTINENMFDEWVKVQGNITQERDIEGLKILTVNDGTASINCVLRKNISYSFKDQRVEIRGKITDYKGDIEIDISKIKIL
jgi:RecJ-like exonuclease